MSERTGPSGPARERQRADREQRAGANIAMSACAKSEVDQ